MAIVVVPLGAASAASAATVLVDIFISKLILIDYILCTREEQQQQQLDRATFTRSLRLSTSLDILNYHFIYNLPASFLTRLSNNVILLLVDFVFESTASAQNVIKVT